MKSKSLEMILDNMYFIASVDKKEEKVFVALDFEDAGRKYAELKSKGDAIVWHLKKKDLISRTVCDFGMPIEMVSDEWLLRLMSLVVVEGKHSPSLRPSSRPTVESREIDRFKRVFYKPTFPHYQCDNGRVVRRSDILCYTHCKKDEFNNLMNSLQKIESFWEFSILNTKTERYTQFISDFDPKDEIATLREQVFVDEHPETISPDKKEIASDENLDAITQIDWDIEMAEDDEELQEIIEEKSMKRFKSQIRELVRKYDMNDKDLVRDVNKFKFDSWFLNLPLNIRKNIVINSIVLGGEEDIEVPTACYLMKLQIQSGDLMDDILRKFGETIKKIEYKDIESKARREKLAARSVRVKIVWEREQKRKSSEEKLPGSTKMKKDSDRMKSLSSEHIPKETMEEDDVKTAQLVETAKPDQYPNTYEGWAERVIGDGGDLTEISSYRYDGVVQRIMESIKESGEEAGTDEMVRDVLKIIEGDDIPDLALIFIGGHIRYMIECNLVETSGNLIYITSPTGYLNADEITDVAGEPDQKTTTGDLVDVWKRWKEPVSTPVVDPNTLKRGVEEWIVKRFGHATRIATIDVGKTTRPIYKEVTTEISKILKQERGISYMISTTRAVIISKILGHDHQIDSGGKVPSSINNLFNNHIRFLMNENLVTRPVKGNYKWIGPDSPHLYQLGREDGDVGRSIPDQPSSEVEEPRSIPSVEVMFEGFDDVCGMKGMTRKSIYRYVSYAKAFIKFVEERGESILDVDERTLEAFKSYLRDDRGFKEGTIESYSASIRAFYDYTNFKGITDVSEPVSHGSKGVKLIVSVRGLLKGFGNNCEMKGLKKCGNKMHPYTSYAKAFIKFVEKNHGTILEVDGQTLDAYKSYLRDDRGLKESSIRTCFTAIRAFCNYINSKGIVNIDIRSSMDDRSGIGDRSSVGDPKRKRTENDWVREILGDDLQKVDIEDLKDGDGKRKSWRSPYTGINQRILLELENEISVSRSELTRSLFDFTGNTPVAVSNIMDAHLSYLVDQGSISRPRWGIYTLVDDDKKLPEVRKVVIDEKHPQKSGLDWVSEILRDKNPEGIAWISTPTGGVMKLVKKGQGRAVYAGINSRILVEIRASKNPVKRSEIVRSVFNLNSDTKIPRTIDAIMSTHLNFLMIKNTLRRSANGYYEMVPRPKLFDHESDPISGQDVREVRKSLYR